MITKTIRNKFDVLKALLISRSYQIRPIGQAIITIVCQARCCINLLQGSGKAQTDCHCVASYMYTNVDGLGQ